MYLGTLEKGYGMSLQLGPRGPRAGHEASFTSSYLEPEGFGAVPNYSLFGSC